MEDLRRFENKISYSPDWEITQTRDNKQILNTWPIQSNLSLRLVLGPVRTNPKVSIMGTSLRFTSVDGLKVMSFYVITSGQSPSSLGMCCECPAPHLLPQNNFHLLWGHQGHHLRGYQRLREDDEVTGFTPWRNICWMFVLIHSIINFCISNKDGKHFLWLSLSRCAGGANETLVL